jgi:hypothetical protein
MTQNLVNDAFWDALFGTFFRIGKLRCFQENPEIYLKKGQKNSKSICWVGAGGLKFCMNMLC